MTARYLLCPGFVTSRTDGDWHYVDARQLSVLYGVPMADCVALPYLSPLNHGPHVALLGRVRRGELIALHPRADGDYRLPEARS